MNVYAYLTILPWSQRIRRSLVFFSFSTPHYTSWLSYCLSRTALNRIRYGLGLLVLASAITKDRYCFLYILYYVKRQRIKMKKKYKQALPSSGTAVYPHMPRANIFDRRQSPSLTDSAPSVEGTGVYRHYLSPRRFVRFWASGEQSSPKWEIPCQWRPWTTLQNLTLLALSYLEKSVTVQKQTNRNKQKQTNSKRYIHTLPIGMCG